MPAFFITSQDIADATVTITGALLHHLRVSLRVRVGETLSLTDEHGRRHLVTVTDVTKDRLTAHIESSTERPTGTLSRVILGQAILKGDRMDWLIQKATELSVERIVPLVTVRGVVRPDRARIEGQRTRWQRIALEAAQQSEQWQVPTVETPRAAHEFFSLSQAAARLVLAERSVGANLSDCLLPTEGDRRVALAVGPEGGWDQDELAVAKGEGFVPVSLGAAILRSETAALAALAVLQSRLGLFGNAPVT